MSAFEEIITCPYNKAHSIIAGRMQFHLARCRAQHPFAEKVPCPFNSTHVVNKVEFKIHQQLCPDRIVLDSFSFKVGPNSKPRPNAILYDPQIIQEENWDDDVLPVSVLDKVKEDSLKKPTLTVLIGAPKSERKAHRFNERLRIQRVLDEQGNMKATNKDTSGTPKSSIFTTDDKKEVSKNKNEEEAPSVPQKIREGPSLSSEAFRLLEKQKEDIKALVTQKSKSQSSDVISPSERQKVNTKAVIRSNADTAELFKPTVLTKKSKETEKEEKRHSGGSESKGGLIKKGEDNDINKDTISSKRSVLSPWGLINNNAYKSSIYGNNDEFPDLLHAIGRCKRHFTKTN